MIKTLQLVLCFTIFAYPLSLLAMLKAGTGGEREQNEDNRPPARALTPRKISALPGRLQRGRRHSADTEERESESSSAERRKSRRRRRTEYDPPFRAEDLSEFSEELKNLL